MPKALAKRNNKGSSCAKGFRGRARCVVPFSLNKILFHFKALLWESIILSSPPPTCIAHPGAIVLHEYWTVYDSPSDLPFVCYTQYKIGNNNIV